MRRRINAARIRTEEISKPSGIDERPEQLRPPIVKAEGSTDSERYLAKLAERSFLNLWSYPTPFRNQKQGGKGDGKELCDLLVVCDPHIIIFSEKTIGWPTGTLEIAWRRWATKAIRNAAKQAAGAERWIKEFPDQIFLDPACEKPFPINFPSAEDRIIHKVIVANGAAKACIKHFPDSTGSLVIRPTIGGDAHWPNGLNKTEPFAIGDIDPEGSFVHVINDAALDVIMRELDTITDFTNYLTKKAAFIRSGLLTEAYGEENLLAYYAIRINEDGDHDFVPDEKSEQITIDGSHYPRFTTNPQYIAKKKADEISYLWDVLIETFTKHMLGGTSITLEGHEYDLKRHEQGVRYMALEPRYMRRCHGEAVKGALEKGRNIDRFFRAIMSLEDVNDAETLFFIHTFKYLDWMEKKGGYETYRRIRTDYARVYAKGLLERHSHLKRVIGISCEPPGQGRGSSEDLIYAEQFDWTDEDRKTIKTDCDEYEVLQEGLTETHWRGKEYPEVETITFSRPTSTPLRQGPLNRKERRAMKAKARKSSR